MTARMPQETVDKVHARRSGNCEIAAAGDCVGYVQQLVRP